MIIFFGFFAIVSTLCASFQDAEFERICVSVGDICHPTLEEYRLIEDYLVSGKRLYLDILRKSDQYEIYQERLKSISNFRLVGSGHHSPIFEDHILNGGDASRCILLYSSSNGIYPMKAAKLLSEIEDSGYKGQLLLRIGGFPNTPNGGLQICDVPYSFKVAFLQEAKLLGFKKILWIDLAIHPLSGFDTCFQEIERTGYFFTTVGKLAENPESHLPQAAEALGIAADLYDRIPHLSSCMIGLNVENKTALQLLENWYRETEKGFPCMTWWPEELSLSVVSWRLGCAPTAPLGNLVCIEHEQFQLENRPDVEFYLDAKR